jgi:nicotinamidase-related amidase
MSYLCEVSRSALIIVDLQEKLMPVIAEGPDVVKRALIIAKVAKLLDIPVLGTAQQPLRLGRTVPEIEMMLDHRIEKIDFDASANPALLNLLTPEQDDLLVLGCEAHICVLQTTLGLLHRKRRVKLVVDAIGSRQNINKAIAIDRARAAGAEIVTSEMVIFEWLRRGDHPKFKEILKLIK